MVIITLGHAWPGTCTVDSLQSMFSNYSVCNDGENYHMFAIRNDEGGAGV